MKDKKTNVISVRFSDSQAEELIKASNLVERDLSSFIRYASLKYSKDINNEGVEQ